MRFDGTWNLTLATPMGEHHVKLELTTEGGAVKGIASLGEDSAPIDNPVLEGDRLRWSQDITRPMSMTVKFDVTGNGDTLQGTAKLGFLATAGVTGARAL
jgi:hypothetical protein